MLTFYVWKKKPTTRWLLLEYSDETMESLKHKTGNRRYAIRADFYTVASQKKPPGFEIQQSNLIQTLATPFLKRK